MERLKAGTSFRDLATGYSEDRNRRPRRRLGFRRLEAETRPAACGRRLNKTPGSVKGDSANGAIPWCSWWPEQADSATPRPE